MSMGCGLGLETYVTNVSSREKLLTSRSREADVSVSAIYVSCPRPTQDHHHRYRADLYCYGASAFIASFKEFSLGGSRLKILTQKSKVRFFIHLHILVLIGPQNCPLYNIICGEEILHKFTVCVTSVLWISVSSNFYHQKPGDCWPPVKIRGAL